MPRLPYPGAVRSLLAALYWAVQVELRIRSTSVDQLARTCGITFDTGQATTSLVPADGGHEAPISARDLAVVRLVFRIYSRWPRAESTCLRQSLVAGRLLRYRKPTLRIGVRRAAGVFRAHAWLEFDGVAIDPAAADYARLTSAPHLG